MRDRSTRSSTYGKISREYVQIDLSSSDIWMGMGTPQAWGRRQARGAQQVERAGREAHSATYVLSTVARLARIGRDWGAVAFSLP